MKRFAIMLCVVASVVCANAKILRVSNVNGSTAPYSSVADALEAAVDGDVIMLDASPNSYGYFVEINKSVTIQGPGYWLTENGIVQEGANAASFNEIRIAADGVKLISLDIAKISSNGHSNWMVNRCKVNSSFEINGKDNHVTIHQNYMTTGVIAGPTIVDDALVYASFLQVTNNIILGGSTQINNSVIKNNTFGNSAGFVYDIKNSTVENNIGLQNINKDGSVYMNNIEIPEGVTYDKKSDTDTVVKEKDALISKNHGAFAGEDPYVISGIAPGPYIEDITVPVSVEQGDDMTVTLKIGQSR